MRRRSISVLVIELILMGGLAAAGPGCAGVTDQPCNEENPCLDALACDPAGVCVPAAPLTLQNERLADGALGLSYRDALRARGGLVPYTYRLVEAPPWMTLDPLSGELGGLPDRPCSALTVRVAVTDGSYGRGQSVEVGLPLDVAACVGGQLAACSYAEDGRCLLGTRACLAGQWGECEDGAPSVDAGQCGPACAACAPERADRCTAGLCACGERSACAAGDTCCAGTCTRLEDDPHHCGACGADCAERLGHVERALCLGGACDYDACQRGFLDCDGDRTNGCETAEGLSDCGGCGVDCAAEVQEAEGPRCAFLPDGGRACDYEACAPGALDCDGDPGNGCERPRSAHACASCADDCAASADGRACLHADGPGGGEFRCGCLDDRDCALLAGPRQCCGGRCVPFDDPLNCGGCGRACAPEDGGPRCLDAATGRCGCLDDGDCGPKQLCCGEVCVPRRDDQCLACGEGCSPAAGGPRCDPAAPACRCQADAECNDLPGGRQTCGALGDPQACTCGLLGRACEGGPAGQCCPGLSGELGCVDLRDDPRSCGGCGQECGPGMECVDGACQCNALDGVGCPALGPAPHCRGVRCVCPAFGDGTRPCAPGMTCCDGARGGEGGPAGGPDEGCCARPCGENEAGECDLTP